MQWLAIAFIIQAVLFKNVSIKNAKILN